MKNSIFSEFNRIFFVGIGGVSMSALCELSGQFGAILGGSDMVESDVTTRLKNKGVKIFVGHDVGNINKFKPNLVVYTGAVNQSNPEIVQAVKLGIKTMERSEFLGEVCKLYQNVIAVSGTHGKTTTSAMISNIFVCAGLNPTCHIGGFVKNFNSNLKIGDTKYFITEACEYKRSFEKIFSTCAVVTNIECDHMDCYADINDLRNSFLTFCNNASTHLITSDYDLINSINKKLNVSLIGKCCGFNYCAKNLKSTKGNYEFDCYKNNKFLLHIKLNIMGKYNVQNALFAIAVAQKFDIPLIDIYNGLNSFCGVMRRNEKMGQYLGVDVFADYCHHPTEILSSIKAFKEVYTNVLCVFQPHTYSRTKLLINSFKTCFLGVKHLVIFKTYAARENYDKLGSETQLFFKVKNKNKTLALSANELVDQINKHLKNIDVIIVLGAGDLYNKFVDILALNKNK